MAYRRGEVTPGVSWTSRALIVHGLGLRAL